MAVNKVEYGGQTLIDLTADTVAEESLVAGATAHNAAGEQISGTFDPSKYAVLTDPNTFIGTQTARKELTIGTSAFMGAQFVADCPNVATKEGIRAGYGFHNEGVTGMCLYLDIDKYLKTIDDTGNTNMRLAGNKVLLKANQEVKCYGTSLDVETPDSSSWAPVRASAFSQQSSRKYKDNIADLTDEDALKLLNLRPVKYDYINQKNGTGCYGLIAEEVDEVMSYPVVYDVDGNPDGIDYSKFVPHLIKMIQIQQNEIDGLKKSNEELEIRLEKLEKLLNTDKEVG